MIIRLDIKLIERMSVLAAKQNISVEELLEKLISKEEEEEAWIIYQSERAERENYYIK